VINNWPQALSTPRRVRAVVAIISAFLSAAAWSGGVFAFFWSLIFLLMLLIDSGPSWDKVLGFLWGMTMIIIASKNACIGYRFLDDPSWKLLGTYLMFSVCALAMPIYFWIV
jgi:hypothetical protein